MSTPIEVLIIGGGPAALSLSYHLSQRGSPHLILEAGRVGESWRTRRWDSLCLVAPNWHMQLPGMPYLGNDPDGFMHRDEVVAQIAAYARAIAAPVREGVCVTALDSGGPARFLAHSSAGIFAAATVVVATGAYTTPHIPAFGARLPPSIPQVPAIAYRNPAQLPPGAVLVVGSGESGCQIAEELRRAGRDVWLSVGRGSWLPRRYRGRDSIAWLTELGAFEQTVDTLPGGDPRQAPPGPQLTGQGGGYDLNLHTLARDGVRLLGRVEDIAGDVIQIAGDLAQRIADGDAVAADFCRSVDAYVEQQQFAAAPEVPPHYAAAFAAAGEAQTQLSLSREGIGAVIWATGSRPQFDWVHVPVLAPDGYPIHTRGVTPCRGLYFLGLEWQHTAASHVFQGIGADAEFIADEIAGIVRPP